MVAAPEPDPREAPRRPWLTLRATLMALAVGTVVYVAIIAGYLVLILTPTATEVRRHSALVAGEYQTTRRREQFLDSVLVELAAVVDSARLREPGAGPVVPQGFHQMRLRLQASFDTTTGLRASRTLGGASEAMRVALGYAAAIESSLGAAMLEVTAALELGDLAKASQSLHTADLLAARLDRVLANVTAMALGEMAAQERALVDSAARATRSLGLWVTLGLVLLPALVWYLQKRFHRPLAQLDHGLDRVMRGDFTQELPASFDDELGRVSAHFNETLAVLREREALEHQQAADRVRARTRLILDASLDAVVAMDEAGRITEWNPQAQAVFGWNRDEVVGRPLVEIIIPPKYRAAHLAGLQRFRESGQTRVLNRRLELEGLCRNGAVIPVELAITPIAEPDGRVGFSGFIRDISARRAAETALRVSEERYRAAFEQSAMGMAELAPDGRFIRVNRTFADIVRYTPDELIGLPASTLTHPADTGPDKVLVADLISGQLASATREKRFLRKDGMSVWTQITLSVVRDSHGEPAHLLLATQDVTARKRLEDELRQSQKLDAVGRLAGGVAHDFNNLLTGIIGYADLVRHSPDTSPAIRQDAEAILLAARRGADLTRNLLTFARRSATRLEPIDLHSVVLEVVELLQRTFDRRIEISLSLEARPSTMVGDHPQLANALLNLALNARDAMGQGGRLSFATTIQAIDAEFCARHAAALEPRKHVVLKISDTGVGMPPETVARVFEPFFTTKAPGKGTGLGLSMVYGTVKAHRGLVTVHSVPGAGTTFTIYLPLADTPVPALSHVTNLPPVRGAGRVLLVDDEQTLRELGQRMLERVGYTVETAANGQEAIDRVRGSAEGFDLVILDWNMPRMSGREACRELVAIRPGLKVMLASGLAETVLPEDLAADGFIGMVQKPYNLAELSSLVATLAAGEPSNRL